MSLIIKQCRRKGLAAGAALGEEPAASTHGRAHLPGPRTCGVITSEGGLWPTKRGRTTSDTEDIPALGKVRLVISMVSRLPQTCHLEQKCKNCTGEAAAGSPGPKNDNMEPGKVQPEAAQGSGWWERAPRDTCPRVSTSTLSTSHRLRLLWVCYKPRKLVSKEREQILCPSNRICWFELK